MEERCGLGPSRGARSGARESARSEHDAWEGRASERERGGGHPIFYPAVWKAHHMATTMAAAIARA